MASITSAKASSDYTLTIDFTNDSKVILDFKKQLKTIRFLPLNDLGTFVNLKVENNVIKWFDKDGECVVEITIDEILYKLKK